MNPNGCAHDSLKSVIGYLTMVSRREPMGPSLCAPVARVIARINGMLAHAIPQTVSTAAISPSLMTIGARDVRRDQAPNFALLVRSLTPWSGGRNSAMVRPAWRRRRRPGHQRVSRMGRRFFLPLLLLVAFLISATSAEAGLRLALVIGNGKYKNVRRLKIPPMTPPISPRRCAMSASRSSNSRMPRARR
jgi:hypothetical protein